MIQKTLAIAATGAVLATALIASNGFSNSTPVESSAKGRVTFDGDIPESKPLTVTEEQSKGCCDPGMKVDDTNRELMVSKDGGIANVVVFVEVDGMDVKPLEEPLLLDQAKCRFEPHISVLPSGSTVHYLNSDSVSHNVHTYATKNKGINQTVSAGSKLPQTLEKAEAVKVTCDIHPWMLSYIYVADTNFYAVTDADGNFEIKGLPAGKHKVEMWHEKLGKAKADLVVKEDGSSEMLEVKMGGKKKKKKGRRR